MKKFSEILVMTLLVKTDYINILTALFVVQATKASTNSKEQDRLAFNSKSQSSLS